MEKPFRKPVAKRPVSSGTKLVADNRRARFDYEILETYEAGVELEGYEVKSVKGGHMGLHGSYAVLQGKQLFLLNAQIPPYQPNNTPDGYDPSQSRRLLLRHEEIEKLAGKIKEKYSIVPLRAELRHGLVKIILGVGRGRKKKDEREYIKSREARREIRQEL